MEDLWELDLRTIREIWYAVLLIGNLTERMCERSRACGWRKIKKYSGCGWNEANLVYCQILSDMFKRGEKRKKSGKQPG